MGAMASRTLLGDPFERANLTISGCALATAAVLASPLFALSVGIGVVLEAANFRALRRATASLFGGELAGGRVWSGLFGLRFLLLGACMYAALAAGAHPIGLVLGLSTIVPSVVLVAWRTPPPPVPEEASALPPDDPSWDRWDPWLARERYPEDEDDS
jgi:hypothetical protein